MRPYLQDLASFITSVLANPRALAALPPGMEQPLQVLQATLAAGNYAHNLLRPLVLDTVEVEVSSGAGGAGGGRALSPPLVLLRVPLPPQHQKTVASTPPA